MRATGIIRRIDELGRVVIPKEIRRLAAISEGDSLEIFYDREGIVLRKYFPTEWITPIVSDLKLAVQRDDCLSNQAALLNKIREFEVLLNAKEPTNDQS